MTTLLESAERANISAFTVPMIRWRQNRIDEKKIVKRGGGMRRLNA